MNYYNENDAEKAAWLRELIRQNVVAPGEVDERSIQQVAAADLRGFRQCHFFAGVGVWSYALRLAGWPDDRPVWTGSCPCPSFSAAGKGEGFDDPRHLWPAWYRLIPQSNPPTIFGEQADDAIGYGWLDLVQTDLERAHYAVGKAVLGACSVGAPHIRQRLYFCAHARWQEAHGEPRARSETRDSLHPDSERSFARRETSTTVGHGNPPDPASTPSLVENPQCPSHPRLGQHGRSRVCVETPTGLAGSSSLSGFWRDAQWLYCRDQKYRPIEPPIFPLADVVPNRVGMLRGAGNAIVPAQAAEFIKAYLDIENE